MEIYRRARFKRQKAKKASEQLEELSSILGRSAMERAQFFLRGPPVARLFKQFPELEHFLREFRYPSSDGELVPFLTNIRTHHQSGWEPRYISPEQIAQIVKGIPRRYSIDYAEFNFLENLPLKQEPTPSIKNEDGETWNIFNESRSHVTLALDWWTSGYGVTAHATEFLGRASDFSDKLPEPTPAFTSLVETFGKPELHLLKRHPPGESKARSDWEERRFALHKDWKKRIWQEVELAGLPHALKLESLTSAQSNPLTLPHKKVLSAAFRPRGYRYLRGGHGGFEFGKRTASGNQVELSFDVGGISRDYSGWLSVRGMKGSVGASIAVTRTPYTGFPIESEEVWQKVVDNAAAMTVHLERVFVPEAEELLGPTPTWYEF